MLTREHLGYGNGPDVSNRSSFVRLGRKDIPIRRIDTTFVSALSVITILVCKVLYVSQESCRDCTKEADPRGDGTKNGQQK